MPDMTSSATNTGASSPTAEPAAVGVGELLVPVRGKLVASCALVAVSSIVGLVPLLAIVELGRTLVDTDGVDTGRLWTIATVAAVALVIRLACYMGALGITHFADNDLQLSVRQRLAEHLGAVPLGWFDERDAGEIKKLVVDDVQAMHQLVGHTFVDITGAVVMPVAAMAYLFTVDWQLSLIVIIPFAIGVGLYAKQFGGYGDKMAKYNEALEDVNVGAVEFVQGIAVVKTFGQAGRAHRRFLDAAFRLVDFFWDWVKGLLRISSAAEVVLSPLMTLVVIASAGAWFVDTGRIAPVDLIAFFVIGLALTTPILTLGFAMHEVEQAQKAAQRVAAVLATPVLHEPDSPQSPADGSIRLDGVHYSYDGERDVLRGIDLDIEPGTLTALVGPSGSGKSTLAKLLCRFWDPTQGAVHLGGVDLRNIARDDLYRRVGFVFQDVQLLRASIADNIALGAPEATRSDVERVARLAQIHDRIVELPDGYDSVVGDTALLSGGERQRLSIARALLADPPILVLDEATSFADPESEASIQDALSHLAAGRTMIVIAHRLSTIVDADQIVVLRDGEIIERGTHDELLALDPRSDDAGEYRRQWDADQRTEATTGAPTGQEVSA
ncbi:MAG: ABC transporter ATP-binding protein [Actinomycetota bacterium]